MNCIQCGKELKGKELICDGLCEKDFVVDIQDRIDRFENNLTKFGERKI